MPSPRFVDVFGTTDGFNTHFTVGQSYIAGSLAVFVNGQLQDSASVTERDRGTGTFDFLPAPDDDDRLQAFLLSPAPDTKSPDAPLHGSISSAQLSGRVSISSVTANVLPLVELAGIISAPRGDL